MSGLSRRQFLHRLGWAGGGLTVISGCGFIPPLPTFGTSAMEDAYSWVQLQADGTVHFYLPRAEMGQGIDTGLSKVVAQELVIGLDQIHCHHQHTGLMAPCQMTVGSQSIENYLDLTALAAATLREQLRQRAALRHEVTATDITITPGGFQLPDGEFVALQDCLMPTEEVLVAQPGASDVERLSQLPAQQRARIDTNVQQIGAHEIVTGAARYSRDTTLADMAFGRVARPPQLGAKLLSFDESAALSEHGVLSVARGPDGAIGLVAETPRQLERGMLALNCQWQRLTDNDLAALQQDLDVDQLAQRGFDHTPINEGAINDGKAAAIVHVEARYDTPMYAHAAMEPRAGVADFKSNANGKSCEIWTGSQDPWLVRSAAARAVGLSEPDVIVHNSRIGGAFGGRLLCQASIEAAWLSKSAGVPVKVQWSREEEFAYNYVGPQFSTRIAAGVDDTGRITYWHHQMVGAPILTSSTFIPRHLYWAADLVADPGTQRGTEVPYQIANKKIEFSDVRVPMPTGAWRGLGAAPNTFAVEVAMDELAERAGLDPLSLRSKHADDPRLQQVIERLRALVANVDQPLGFAATAYKGVTFVAIAAAVDVSGARPTVKRLWCVHDCGRVIAEDRVLAQIEGNLVWGIGMALSERFALANGLAATDNFHNYRPPRMDNVPEMIIELLESDLPPSGAGEAAFAPCAAAIVNAVYHHTGQRHRALPVAT